MGCPDKVIIGENLVFDICTHDTDTGVLTDADSAPAYRVYEDENSTAILNGTMAKLDDANTTGNYSELITCSSGNGFEHGKTYTIYIEATVDSVTGGMCYGFKAWDGKSTIHHDSSKDRVTHQAYGFRSLYLYNDKIFCNRDVEIATNKQLKFLEGANHVGFEAPALSADQIWTLPNADGAASTYLQTDGSGTLSWAAVGSVSFGADNQIPYTNNTTDDFDYSANFTFSGTELYCNADIDINGNDIFLDADKDSYLHASADDVVDLVLAGASGEFAVNINSYEALKVTDHQIQLGLGTQDYVISQRASSMSFQGQTAGSYCSFEVFSKDGDGTDNVIFQLFGVGTPASIVNSERLLFQNNATTDFRIYTQAGGSGTLRPLILFTTGNTDQLKLETDGDVYMSGKLGVGTTPSYALHVDESITSLGAQSGSWMDLTHTPSGAAWCNVTGVFGRVITAGSNSPSPYNVRGLHGMARHEGSNNVTTLIGLRGNAYLDTGAGGTVTDARGLEGESQHYGGTCTNAVGVYGGIRAYNSVTNTWCRGIEFQIHASATKTLTTTNAAGLYFNNTNAGTLTCTNWYGIYFPDMSSLGGTLSEAIHTEGGDWVNLSDSSGAVFGAGRDAKIHYDGTDLVLDSAVVGSGVLKFGTHTAIGAETVTGYITIKDSAGNTRKLAVVS